MNAAFIEKVREHGIEIGYRASVGGFFASNPYHPSDPLYEHWADGCALGIHEAREELGLEPANDN